MTTHPGDGTAAAAGAPDQGHLRASHADRARVTDVLKAAFGEGRLTQEELDARAAQASSARTYAELATLTADLPAGADLPVGAAAARQARERAQTPSRTAAQTGACVIVFAASVLTVLLLEQPMTTLAFVAALGAAVTIVLGSILTAALMLDARHQPRSGSQQPPRPATGGGGAPPDGPA